jgi:hypothetical protein
MIRIVIVALFAFGASCLRRLDCFVQRRGQQLSASASRREHRPDCRVPHVSKPYYEAPRELPEEWRVNVFLHRAAAQPWQRPLEELQA